MNKEYIVYYKRNASDNTVTYGVIVKTLEGVKETKRRIREAGYGFLDVKWRERGKHIDPSEGWKTF